MIRSRQSGPDPSPGLILASASPRRAQLLRALGLPFSVVPTEVPEVAPEFLSPAETAQLNAVRKAQAAAIRHPDSLIIGADTMVTASGVHYGKPASLAEAEAMLAQLQGRVHQVATGVCLIHQSGGRRRVFAVTTAVTFRRLGPGEIREYLSSIHPFDKAGGYAIQDGGHTIIECIHGSYSNVVGLPLERLREELAGWLGRPPGNPAATS